MNGADLSCCDILVIDKGTKASVVEEETAVRVSTSSSVADRFIVMVVDVMPR